MNDNDIFGKASKNNPVYWHGAGTPNERFIFRRRSPEDRAVYRGGDKWHIEGLDDVTTDELINLWRHADGKIYPEPS
jgi:hypothetical protein